MNKNVINIIKSRRSLRRFRQDELSREVLSELVACGAMAPSAMNLQPLEFLVIDKPELCRQIFPYTRWAAYLGDKGRPAENQAPVAYIAVLYNELRASKFNQYDIGAAVENIILAAHSLEIGSCWLGGLDRDKLVNLLKIKDNYKLDSLIALGYPDHSSEVYECEDNIKYSMDNKQNFKVPKRPLNSIIKFAD